MELSIDTLHAQHDALRELIAILRERLQVARHGTEIPVAALAEQTAQLLDTLLEHIDAEDAILDPVLRQKRGDAVADAMTAHHHAQRDAFQQTIKALRGGELATAYMVTALEDIMGELARDMEHEEKNLFPTAE